MGVPSWTFQRVGPHHLGLLGLEDLVLKTGPHSSHVLLIYFNFAYGA